MTPPITRELSIRYGSLTVGGTSSNLRLTGIHRLRQGVDSAEVEFSFLVVESNEPAFAQTCTIVEEALAKPFQGLSVTQAGSVLRSYGNSPGHEARPEIVKVADQNADSGRTRLYRARISISLPASKYPTKGLRESNVSIEVDASGRRRVVLSGVWTASGNSTALSQFEAGVSAWENAALSTIGGGATYERIGNEHSYDVANHEVQFRREHLEIIFNQSGGSLDDLDLADVSLVLTRRDFNPGDSARNPVAGHRGGGTGSPIDAKVSRLVEVNLLFEAAVLHTQTQELGSKYDAIREWLIDQIKQTVPSAGAFALLDDTPEFDRHRNRLRVRMTALVASDGQGVFERRVSVSEVDDQDETLVPVWNGNRYSRHVYEGPATLKRTYQEEYKTTEHVTALQAAQRARRLFPRGGNWTKGVVSPRVEPLRIGGSKQTIDGTLVSYTITREYFERVSGGGGRTVGGPAPSTTPNRNPQERRGSVTLGDQRINF